MRTRPCRSPDWSHSRLREFPRMAQFFGRHTISRRGHRADSDEGRLTGMGPVLARSASGGGMLQPRALVLYGTTDGHTRRIATVLAEALRSQDLDVDVVNAAAPFDPEPEDYAGVIVAASIRGGRYQRSARRWATRHAAALGARPAALVTVCLSVLDRSEKTATDLERLIRRFCEETGWHPSAAKTVAGALLYTQYGWLTRWIMRRISAKHHGDTDTSRDYVYTDWDDLRAFGDAFGRRIANRFGVKAAV